MFPSLETTNFLVALGTIVLQFVLVFLIVVLWGAKKYPALAEIKELVKNFSLPASFLLVFVGSATSLYYSEILGLPPCGLCWLQRAVLYPQVILFAIAWKKQDLGIAIYSIALSATGALIALYHHAIQMGFESPLPCPAVASTANCAQRFFFEFGYLTFPLVSFISFALLIVLMLFLVEKPKTAAL